MAAAIQSLGCVNGIFITIAVQETSSQLAWSFARDGGIVMSKYMQLLHPKLEIPHFALVFTYFLVFLCGLLYLASATGKLSQQPQRKRR
jgi:choline transport protein